MSASLFIEGEMKRSYQGGMGKSKVAILLLLGALFASCISLNIKVEARTSSPLEIQIDAKLKLLNKPAVKTIMSEDGDIIDCVDIYKQPAFDHPALKNHTIQMIPEFLLESQDTSTEKGSLSESIVFQTWRRSGSCPKGTVPIRRILKEDLLRSASLKRFGMKPPQLFKNSTYHNLNVTTDDINIKVPENRSAAYLMTTGSQYIGTKADINIWNPVPNVELPDDYTTAQIWVKTANGPDFESVEAGWMVYPKLYHDKVTRFFVSWTKDSYKSTGCFDLICSGFVQITSKLALGAAIEHVSSLFGTQYEKNVAIFMDRDGNWRLKLDNHIYIGYWPAEIMGNLRYSATLVEWGGQVFSSDVKKTPHTRTGMGSGNFAEGVPLLGHACYIRNIRIEDNSQTLKYPQPVSAMADEPNCYNSKNYIEGDEEDPVFYFGGPGRNHPRCP